MKGWMLLLLASVLVLAGCRTSRPDGTPRPDTTPERTPETRPEPDERPVPAPPGTAIPYQIVTDSCMCQEFEKKDPKLPVTYGLVAEYDVQDRVTTRIELTLRNDGDDTLDTSLGYVRVASRNVAYQYNNRFVPIPMSPIAPHDEKTFSLVGKAVKSNNEDPWLDMAGERLVVTIKGLRLGRRRLAEQVITLIPHNPRFVH